LEARNRTLAQWFGRLETGQILLPRFQRFESWDHQDIASLLSAVLRSLPVGATLVLEVGDDVPFEVRQLSGAPVPKERVNELLLDGQQRLTALWRSFHDDYEERTYYVYFDEEEFDSETVPGVLGQGRSMRNGQRYPLWANDPKQVNARGYVPLSPLLPGDIGGKVDEWCDAATETLSESRDLSRKVSKLREPLAAFNIPFLSLPAVTSKPVALDVFIKMNTTLVPLTPFGILVAQVEGATEQSLQELVALLGAEVPAVTAFGQAESLALDIACLLQDRPPTQASYYRLDLKQLVSEWETIVECVRFAVDFLDGERIFDAARLPSQPGAPGACRAQVVASYRDG